MPTTRLPVRVTPRSGRDEVTGWEDGELRVRVTVPAEGGRANAAVCEMIAREIGAPKSAVRVVRGASSRHKTLEIDVAEGVDVRERLGGSPV